MWLPIAQQNSVQATRQEVLSRKKVASIKSSGDIVMSPSSDSLNLNVGLPTR